MQYIMSVNAGSSSLKLSATPVDDVRYQILVEAAMQSDAMATVRDAFAELQRQLPELTSDTVVAVGHRVVHGGDQAAPARLIDADMLAELRRFVPFDPTHMPIIVTIIEALQQFFSPAVTHVACFDTAFFHDVPEVAQLIALPERYRQLGIKRYGFHGLSYSSQLATLIDVHPEIAHEKIVLAHLGSGSSLAAVSSLSPVDMTMGFTPTSGIVMSSRLGEADPSIYSFLQAETGLTVEAWQTMINTQSGLLGISGDTADMRTLLDHEDTTPNAQTAVALYVYQVQKAIGALTASMGGVDRLVFAGGIGERSVVLRQRIIEQLGFLGFQINEIVNADARVGPDQPEWRISQDGASKPIHVIHSDENTIIAAHTKTLAGL